MAEISGHQNDAVKHQDSRDRQRVSEHYPMLGS